MPITEIRGLFSRRYCCNISGLQYVIDKVDRNCTIQAIPEGDFGAAHTPVGLDNSTWSLRMKTQYEILHMDSKYLFVGQVRAFM